MLYENCIDKSINGYDATFYIHDDNTCTLDIKYPCGEIIKGFSKIINYKKANQVAKLYVYALGTYQSTHCKNEYCLN